MVREEVRRNVELVLQPMECASGGQWRMSLRFGELGMLLLCLERGTAGGLALC